LTLWPPLFQTAALGTPLRWTLLLPVALKPQDAPSSIPQAEPHKPALTVELGAARIVVPVGVDRATLKTVLDALGEQATRAAR
jgi:hypothetical protein